MLARVAAGLAVVIAFAVPGGASEGDLVRAFVGRPVLVLMDLPATTSGLDFYPRRGETFDATELQQRLIRSGVGIRRHDVMVVTKIKVKKKHIEFQLGAGGASQLPSRPSSYVPESKLEKELEDQLKEARSESEEKRLKTRLAEVRDRREREQRRREARAEEEYQRALSERSPEEWALLAGSRINVRFDDRVPQAVLSPEGFTRALNGVVDFNPPPEAVAARGEDEAPLESSALPVHKGQSRDDVDDRLGPPDDCARGVQGGLKIDKCTYDLDEATLEASFAGGVLVHYVITSN